MVTEKQVKDAIIAAGIDVDVNKIGIHDNLGEFGLDSLDFFNLFLELEDVGGRPIPDDQVDQLYTIDSIMQFYSE